MSGKQGTIGVIPLLSIMALGIGLMNHVMVIPPMLSTAGRDAWLSVVAIAIPYTDRTSVMFGVMRWTGQQPLLTWLRQSYGVVVSGTFRTLFTVYIFIICVMTLKDTTMWTQNSYLTKPPTLPLSLTMILPCVFAARSGVQALAITSGILLPFVVIFGDFVMSANLPAKNYTLLMPMLEHGLTPMLTGSMYAGGGLVELIVLLLFQHHLKTDMKLWKLLLFSLFLLVLITGPIIGAITEFGPNEAAKLRYPAFEEWRLVKIGKYIRHVDFLSIYQWLSGAFIRLAGSLLLLADLLADGKRKQIKNILIWIMATVSVIIVQLPISDMQYTKFLRYIYLPVSCWGVTGSC